MRHFSNLTQKEVHAMSTRMELAAVAYAQEIGMSGLSHLGVHDIYGSTQEMLTEEWKKSKRNFCKRKPTKRKAA